MILPYLNANGGSYNGGGGVVQRVQPPPIGFAGGGGGVVQRVLPPPIGFAGGGGGVVQRVAPPLNTGFIRPGVINKVNPLGIGTAGPNFLMRFAAPGVAGNARGPVRRGVVNIAPRSQLAPNNRNPKSKRRAGGNAVGNNSKNGSGGNNKKKGNGNNNRRGNNGPNNRVYIGAMRFGFTNRGIALAAIATVGAVYLLHHHK